jgi:branched-chain amino acid transport system permease protein
MRRLEDIGFSRAQTVALFALVLAVAAAPFGFYPIFVMQVMCFALFAASTNLLMGFIGLLSLGQAAYFGVGAYTAGYAVQTLGLTPEIGILLGSLAGGLLGAGFGWLVVRRTAVAFAMITLALAQVADFIATELPDITGGENGIQNIPRGKLFGWLSLADDRAIYAVVAIVFIAGVLFSHRVMHSPFGQIVKAIRDNEPRAVSLGFKPEHYKWIVFILAGSMAGLAVVAMQYYLAPLGAWIIVIQGVIFIVCVLTFRRGVIGEIGTRLRIAL